jgi:hypothetical protein
MIHGASGLCRVAAGLAFFAALWMTGTAAAQSTCDYAACPANTTYHDGGCYDSPQFFTNAQSHTRAVCNAGDTLNNATGLCHKANCIGYGGPCQEKALCPAGTTYGGSDTGPRGPFGVCNTGPVGPGGYLSHQLVYCDAGWTLNTVSGTCKRCLIVPHGPLGPLTLLPDLVIRNAWLASPASTNALISVRTGQPYRICYAVANIGPGPSAAFTVQGGGLGVPVSPTFPEGPLAAGAVRDHCLSYAAAPAPGLYNVEVTADSAHAVTETNEANNSFVVRVKVVR